MPKFEPRPGRGAMLIPLTCGEFEVVLDDAGVQQSRHFTASPAQAGNIIRAWQGPLTDRRARYSVRRAA